jgi:tetratricopeptide (TPR) repeat protein
VDEAWQFRRQAFLIDPLVDLKPLALMIVPASALGLRGNRGAAYTSFMNGLGSFWDGQYGRAADFLHELAGKVTEADRQRFASWFLWYEALAAAHVGDFGLAAGDLRILLARAEARDTLGGGAMLAFSNANHYRYTLACVLDIGGQSQAALLLLQEVATQDAGLYMAHTRMAGIYDGLHRPVAALEERKRAVAANPDDGTLLFELGDALARAGEFADAQGALRQARHANPRNVRALYLLGMVASQVGDIDEAQDAFRQFLVLAPSRFSDQKAEVTLHLEKLR